MELAFFIMVLAMAFAFLTPHTLGIEIIPVENEPCRQIIVSSWGGHLQHFNGVLCDGDTVVIEGKEFTVPEGGITTLDEIKDII